MCNVLKSILFLLEYNTSLVGHMKQIEFIMVINNGLVDIIDFLN